jgi:dTDP-glucose pyrophosphorylase
MSDKKPTLLVLAAGMGSRYGGLKQIDPVGPSGEVVLDYSVYDAIRAGFGKVVFLIRRDIEKDFRDALESHFIGQIEVAYAYQELDDLPGDVTVPEGRVKPWGTGHAMLCCRDVLDGPFAVINADDFYGATSFALMAEKLKALEGKQKEYCMVGFEVRNVVSDHGGVTRGICQVGESDLLETVVESEDVQPEGTAYKCRVGEGWRDLTGNEIVSMNFWGFTPDVLDLFEGEFTQFLAHLEVPEKSEFLIPTVIDDMIQQKALTVEVMASAQKWYGVTYPEDKPTVQAGIGALVEKGDYPANLWPSA